MFPRDQDQQREVMYEAQLKTNELLETLVELLKPKASEQTKTTVIKPANRSTRKPRGKAQ